MGSPAPTVPGRLDWCCIGAQKAGTSTLYHLLREHPRLRMPSTKEDPIFDAPVRPEQVRRYLDDRFADEPERRCGTVTPQYMSSPDTAARLHAYAPDARIVVLLRDPAKRAASHFRMSVLRELETRSFDDAVRDQLDVDARAAEVDLQSETDTYVLRGHYAWLLRGWVRCFGRERLFVVFNSELDRDPAATVARVHAFLGVDPAPPANTEFRFNATPPPHRFSAWRKPVARRLRRLGWERLHPETREQISARVEKVLARVVPRPADGIAPDTARALLEHYAEHDAALEDLLGCALPWRPT